MTTIMGLDLSLSGTGVAVLDYDTGERIVASQISTPAAKPLADRLRMIRDFIRTVRDRYEPNEIWNEQPICWRSGSTSLDLGRLHGVVLMDNPLMNDVNISTIKKFATGNGKAKKPEMVSTATDRWPVDDVRRRYTDNMADALWIAEYGRTQSIAEWAKRAAA